MAKRPSTLPLSGACTLTSGEFTNRFILVEGSDAITMDVVCFNSCDACDCSPLRGPRTDRHHGHLPRHLCSSMWLRRRDLQQRLRSTELRRRDLMD